MTFLLRRLWQSLLTVAGVMLVTFVLFRQIAGDVSAAFVNQRLGREARQVFYEKHKLDRPPYVNFHRRVVLEDSGSGPYTFSVADSAGGRLASALGLHRAQSVEGDGSPPPVVSHPVFALRASTLLERAIEGDSWFDPPPPGDTAASPPLLVVTLRDGTRFSMMVDTLTTVGSLLNALEQGGAGSTLRVGTTSWSPSHLFDSQLFWHLRESVTFSGRSYATDQGLWEIIRERARFSLALTLPMLALGWFLGLVLSCLVAWFRDGLIDRLGVFLAVLGMCIPYLAYMLLGQWALFRVAPALAAGLSHPGAIFVPVTIAVIAGLGGHVRFYRTILLDQVNQDYVRTARAKGVSAVAILFRHVLRNSMLPILTNLVTAIPFLVMGSLLLERFFGIPGLGDLMMTSIYSRDVPIITGLTFLTAVLYVASLLVTDLLYAVFDPRVRLR